MLLRRQMLSAGAKRVAGTTGLATDGGERTKFLVKELSVCTVANVTKSCSMRMSQMAASQFAGTEFKYEFPDRDDGADTSTATALSGRTGN